MLVLLKTQTAVQMCPREGDMETYTHNTFQYLSPIDFTEIKIFNTTEDLGPMWVGEFC